MFKLKYKLLTIAFIAVCLSLYHLQNMSGEIKELYLSNQKYKIEIDKTRNDLFEARDFLELAECKLEYWETGRERWRYNCNR